MHKSHARDHLIIRALDGWDFTIRLVELFKLYIPDRMQQVSINNLAPFQ